MRVRLVVHAALLAAVTGALSAGCHRASVQTSTAPLATMPEEHCWWAPFRTGVPPDSVAARYADAYTRLGLGRVGWSHEADTAWAQGGPSVLTRPDGTGMLAARVVAYRRADTTLIRQFVGVRPEGSANGGGLIITFCGDASRESQVHAVAPRDEERDDSLPVWRRRPTH